MGIWQYARRASKISGSYLGGSTMLALRNVAPRLCAALMLAALSFASTAARADGNLYQQHNLVSDVAGVADHTDPNLVNAWGIAFNPTGPVWIADNGTGLSTLYNGA